MISRSNWAKLRQNVERQPAHRVRRIEVLRDGHERDIVSFEGFDDSSEVHQRPAEPVNLVNDHAIDLPSLDVGEQCRFSAGRSMLPPVKPPSSYLRGRQIQPSAFWLAMYASAASRWASSELKSC
jgi:hypothetical protein